MPDGQDLLSSIKHSCHVRSLDQKRAEELIQDSGLSPIFEQQTPKVPILSNTTEEVLKTIYDLLVFAEHNPYLRLAGLASNQIGYKGERLQLNVCFVNKGFKDGWVAALNPEILSTEGGSRSSTEGCLTWPKKQIHATRHDIVRISYLTVENEKRVERIEGFEAIVWQHEINHLKGIPERVLDPFLKIKPNAPCPCQSGRKFKACCGR